MYGVIDRLCEAVASSRRLHYVGSLREDVPGQACQTEHMRLEDATAPCRLPYSIFAFAQFQRFGGLMILPLGTCIAVAIILNN